MDNTLFNKRVSRQVRSYWIPDQYYNHAGDPYAFSQAIKPFVGTEYKKGGRKYKGDMCNSCGLPILIDRKKVEYGHELDCERRTV